jgi:hypothetical protein
MRMPQMIDDQKKIGIQCVERLEALENCIAQILALTIIRFCGGCALLLRI